MRFLFLLFIFIFLLPPAYATTETLRPTAYVTPSEDFLCYADSNTAMTNPQNASDTNLSSYANGAASGTYTQTKARTALYKTWIPNQTYFSLKLIVKSSGTITGDAGGDIEIQYSNNSGSTWYTVKYAFESYSEVNNTITLPSSLNLSKLQVRAAYCGYMGDSEFGISPGIATLKLFDIRTEGNVSGAISGGTGTTCTSGCLRVKNSTADVARFDPTGFIDIKGDLTEDVEDTVANQGPKNATAAVNDSSVGTIQWSNPTNVFASDNAYAIAGLRANNSYYLKATNFGFSIPSSATINGVVVEVERSANETSPSIETLRPTAYVTPSIEFLDCYADSNTSMTNPANANDTNLSSFANGAAIATTTLTKARTALYTTWQANTSTYSSLKLVIKNSGTIPITTGGGVIGIEYSNNSGSTWYSVRYAYDTYNEVNDTVTLLSNLNLSRLQVRVSYCGFTDDADPGSATLNLYDIRTEGTVSTPAIVDKSVKIVKSNVISGNEKADTTTAWPGTDTTKTYGSYTDLWGLSWTASDINAANFGVAISANRSGGSTVRNARIDRIRITVNYTDPFTAPANSFVIKNPAGTVMAYIDKNGNMETRGSFTKTSSPSPSGNDDYIIKNSTGAVQGFIDGATGDMLFKGDLHYFSSFT